MKATAANPLLIRKYNRPVPRYTSYPTVPFWNAQLDAGAWMQNFKTRFGEENHVGGISLYIHLPFCESLCTYCGCNKKITTNHGVEEDYLLTIIKEWNLYRSLMTQVPVIRELHLGGGTPTFFSPANLRRLLEPILKSSIVHPDHDFSIEGHPNNTSIEHLKTLYALGFRRISYGVQDNDENVQRIINRIQPLENVKRATEYARSVGFRSVNFDLIYGLPLQTIESIGRTIRQVMELAPDRIAFYSYAHVPWTSRAQRLFDESDLPSPEAKMRLYLTGKQLLVENGYTDIGMDHFALPTDALHKAWMQGTLHRNFMGYTTQSTNMLLGLGVSSISDTGNAFAQNEKTIHGYYDAIARGVSAARKGFFLSAEDLSFRKYIRDISCRGRANFQAKDIAVLEQYTFPRLEELSEDGLIEWNAEGLKVTATGYQFIRIICSAFDLFLQRNTNQDTRQVFSKAI